MNKCVFKKSYALALVFAFLCLVSCVACISKDREAAEKSQPHSAEEEPPVEKPAEAAKPAAKAEPKSKVASLATVPIIKERPEPPIIEEKIEPPPPAIEEKIGPSAPIIEEKTPAPAEEPPPAIEAAIEADDVVAVVDDVVITREEHLQTKSEVEAVVDELNEITRNKNYSRWLTYLDGDYRETLSDRDFLAQISNSLPRALRERHVRLATLKDYFDYVFVPSRQNVRVDDIQYITPTRVYVIMDLANGGRAAVYILEKGDDSKWRLAYKK